MTDIGITDASDIRLMADVAIIHTNKTRHFVCDPIPDDFRALYEDLAREHTPLSKTLTDDFSLEWSGARWRVHVYHSNRGWTFVLRRFDDRIKSLLELGFQNPEFDVLSLCRDTKLTLFCGETGAGKSSTLAAASEALAAEGLRGVCVTVENPVERLYDDPLVTQREVGVDVENFSQGVRQAMRQSPSTLIIGEIRDRETAGAAIQAGLTGHRVLATLHAESVEDVFARMWAFLDDAHDDLLLNALQGIIVQHLLHSDGGEPVLMYESLQIDSVIRNILGSPDDLSQVDQLCYQQRRDRLGRQAQELVACGRVPRHKVARWL